MIYYDADIEGFLDEDDDDFLVEMEHDDGFGYLDELGELEFVDQKEFWSWYKSGEIHG